MAHKVIWSEAAVADLQGIVRYIARDSETHAAAHAERIYDAIDKLALFPLMGRHVPEIEQPDIREVIVGNYRIVYRVHADAVGVAGIIHGARLLLDALGDRPL